jgi:hypothetical protein
VSLVSVLLLRYQDVKNEFPSSTIIREMENKSISLDKLNEWSNLIRSDFVTRNATSLPISSEDQDTSIPLVDLQTQLSTNTSDLTILNGNIMHINIELAEQKQTILTVQQSIDEMELKLGIIMDLHSVESYYLGIGSIIGQISVRSDPIF